MVKSEALTQRVCLVYMIPLCPFQRAAAAAPVQSADVVDTHHLQRALSVPQPEQHAAAHRHVPVLVRSLRQGKFQRVVFLHRTFCVLSM